MKGLKAILFSPFGAIWWGITFLRRMLYQWKIKTRYISHIETICIGNLKVGGTGKTPHILAFVEEYANRNIAILSRGYGRKSRGLLVVDVPNAIKFGDEPSMLKQKLPLIPIVVSESRVNGLKYIEKHYPNIDLILLDDAFQHLAVQCTRYVLLTEFHAPYFKDWILPMGWLRESRYFSKEADEVIVTKCPELLTPKTKDWYVKKIGKKKAIRFSKMSYATRLFFLDGASISWADLGTEQHLLVTGIANPNPLLTHLNQKKVLYCHRKFSDHHRFNSKEITYFIDYLNQRPKAKLITTEKDAVRLSEVTSLAKRLVMVGIKVDYNHGLDGTD